MIWGVLMWEQLSRLRRKNAKLSTMDSWTSFQANREVKKPLKQKQMSLFPIFGESQMTITTHYQVWSRD